MDLTPLKIMMIRRDFAEEPLINLSKPMVDVEFVVTLGLKVLVLMRLPGGCLPLVQSLDLILQDKRSMSQFK